MLVRSEDDHALAIGQLSHSWVSGQLARAWGNDRFAVPEPREAIALGAEQHDIGWAEFDRTPRFDPATGLPATFLQLSLEEFLAIWRDAPDRLLSQSAHAALVVSLHGRALSQLRAHGADGDDPALAENARREQQRQQRLCAALGVAADELQVIQRLMWTWDGLSLALCHGWLPFAAKDVPARSGLVELELRAAGRGSLTLEPWPFAAARVVVGCEARRLAARYADADALHAGFAAAPLEALEFELVAP